MYDPTWSRESIEWFPPHHALNLRHHAKCGSVALYLIFF